MADNNAFWISEADKSWVHDNFRWLIYTYGYPHRTSKTILFTKEFFAATFSDKQIHAGTLIKDLCSLLSIPENIVTYELVEDARDALDMPYEIAGQPFECELEILEERGEATYHIILAKTLLKHPGRLLLNLVVECVRIRQFENKIDFENIEENDLLMYHIAIFFGYGILLYQNLVEQGRSNDGLFWETKWNFTSLMPLPVMAYSLALYYDLKEETDGDWKNQLKPDLKKQFEQARDYIKVSGNPLFDKEQLTILDLMKEADDYYFQNDFKNSNATLQKVLFLRPRLYLRPDLYISIGYNYLRMEEYEKSIFHFQKALQADPGHGYANDNLGFAFIMLGDLETGKFYLDAAIQTGNNDPAYSYRNFALYHLKRKEYALAEQNFQKAFESVKIPVDLLELFYARYLFETGDNEKGMEFLTKAVEKGEPEAIRFMHQRGT